MDPGILMHYVEEADTIEQGVYSQYSQIAREVLRLSKNQLLVNLRFLDAALSRLQQEENNKIALATDGRVFFYAAQHILRRYKEERTAVTRDYLHVLLHCVFRHMFIHNFMDQPLWNLACDIAVESCISSLGIRALTVKRESEQNLVCQQIQSRIGVLTAEKIYRYLSDNISMNHEFARWASLFMADSHALWYSLNENEQLSGSNDSGKASGSPDSQDSEEKSNIRQKNDSSNHRNTEQDNDSGSSDESYESKSPNRRNDDTDAQRNSEREANSELCSEADWKQISERMQVEMEAFSMRQGYTPGALLQNLKEVNRERYDYSAFLRKFAVLGEVMKVNDDEFDYVFYTYGLQLYRNMPLIEPLEYKEVKRIREFVIAIDTSGSVQGSVVQSFVQKTYNILKSTESLFSKINLHIIQCDAAIREDAKITTQEEFDHYLSTMQIRGLGGTDFRPVFSYVDELQRQHEFSNLKGLIYLTDGCGTFPKQKPPYSTAFVFLDEANNNYNVPSWAIKLVLRKEELLE